MPPDIRRNKQCLALFRRAESDDQNTLHDTVTTSAPGRKRLQSRHPFSEQAKQLTSDAQGKTNRIWAKGTWKIRWDTTHCLLSEFIHTPSSKPICHDLTRHSLVRLDRVRTGYGRFKYSMLHLLGLSPSHQRRVNAALQARPLTTLSASVLYTVAAVTWGHFEHDRTQRLGTLQCAVWNNPQSNARRRSRRRRR